MPSPTPFKPINLNRDGIVKRGGTPLKPMQKSFPLPKQEPATIAEMMLGQPTGPAPDKRKYQKDELKSDVQFFTQRVMDYMLQGDRLEQHLAVSSLKDISVTMGRIIEYLMLLEGQPTQIVSQQQHQTMDKLLPVLMQEMQRRGVKMTATERKIEMTNP